MVENSRIRYIQFGKKNDKKKNEPAEVEDILKSCIHEHFQEIKSKVQKQTKKINDLEVKMAKKLDAFKKDLLDAFSQSLKSAKDVHQNVVPRVSRRKKRSFAQL